MTLRPLISLSLALLVWQNADAQFAPADDFFNGGAQFYISNNIPSALERAESGLKFYPDDVKLKKLEQLLKQQQQQQKDRQDQQQKSKDQQQQKQSSPQKKDQDQQKQDEQKNSQADQKKDEGQKQQQPSTADRQKADQPEKQEDGGEPVKPGQMTPAEAKRLLDAQKDKEQILHMKPKDKPEQNQRPVKDW